MCKLQRLTGQKRRSLHVQLHEPRLDVLLGQDLEVHVYDLAAGRVRLVEMAHDILTFIANSKELFLSIDLCVFSVTLNGDAIIVFVD